MMSFVSYQEFSDPEFADEVYESISTGVDLLSYSRRVSVDNSIQHRSSRYHLFTEPIRDPEYWKACQGRSPNKRSNRFGFTFSSLECIFQIY